MKNFVAVTVNSEQYGSGAVYVLETDKAVDNIGFDLFGAYSDIASAEMAALHLDPVEKKICVDDVDCFYNNFGASVYERVYVAEDSVLSGWCLQVKPLQSLVDWFKTLNVSDVETQSKTLSSFQQFTSVYLVPAQYNSKAALIAYLSDQKNRLLKEELSFYQPEEAWDVSWGEKIPDDFFSVSIKKCATIQC